MEPEQIEMFRQKLEAIRQEMQAAIDTATEIRPVALDPSRFGRLARMDALQDQAMAKELQRRKEVRLQQVQSALARIKADAYGACLACEEDIGLRRLESDPALTHCIACTSRSR